jgi:hypothetical protein
MPTTTKNAIMTTTRTNVEACAAERDGKPT